MPGARPSARHEQGAGKLEELRPLEHSPEIETSMKWMLVERRPDVVAATAPEIYLGPNDGEVDDVGKARTFDTREAAEAHRRTLKLRYHWVAMTVPDGRPKR